MDEAIADYVKRKHNLLIGERTAEKIKIEVGSASALEEPRRTEAKGRDLVEMTVASCSRAAVPCFATWMSESGRKPGCP